MANADMLHHADRDDAIELPGQLAIIDLDELDLVGDAGRRGALARNFYLFRRDVDGGDMRARSREMNGEAAPARTDFAHPHAGLERELRSSVDELVALRLFQRVARRVAEIAAGILHVVVEKEPIQRGRKIIMMARVFCGDADGIGLLPAPQRSEQPPPQLRGLLGVESAAVE